jgi:hypothetical protein
MGTLGTALVGSRSSDATCAVEPPTITPGWEDGNRARRWAEKSLFDRVLGSLFSDQRRHPRFFAPPIVAYLGGVGSSKLFPIVNVSVSGFCLRANEFWTPGAVMPVTLQRWRKKRRGWNCYSGRANTQAPRVCLATATRFRQGGTRADSARQSQTQQGRP